MLRFRTLIGDIRGASAIEYALVASLIAIAGIVAFRTLGDRIDNSFTNISNTVETHSS
ncbi:MAG TPA: Flp family type IVb pilin [Allosphingosinicella sp.]|nr:Flp family type IVb pilin [Allosphingosinicella sp.]